MRLLQRLSVTLNVITSNTDTHLLTTPSSQADLSCTFVNITKLFSAINQNPTNKSQRFFFLFFIEQTRKMLVNNLPSPPEMKVSRVIFVRAFNCSSWSSPNKCICWPWVDCLQGRESDSKNTLSRNDWASNTYINTKINTFLWLQFLKKRV